MVFDRLVMKEGSHCSICYPPHHLLDMEVLFWDFPIKDKSHKWELVLCTRAQQFNWERWTDHQSLSREEHSGLAHSTTSPPRQIQPRVSLYVGYDTTLEQICTPSSFQRVRNSPALECFEGSGERSHPLHWIPTACNVTTVVHYSASNHFKFLFPDSEPTLNVLLFKHLSSSF